MERSIRRKYPGIALAAALAAHAACAQQDVGVPEGAETVVTAARMAQAAPEALRATTVITRRDIENAGQLTLGEVLQLYGGVELATNGGPGGASAVFIRGANSAHSLVLVDGMRVQSATTGTTAFENLPLAEIERIEIVPGPVSGLYGSDAIGGVIQIFTKGARHAPAPALSAGAGSYGTRSLAATWGGAAGDTTFGVSAGWSRTDGFSATGPTVPFGQFNPDDDGYRNANASAKVEHAFGPGQALGASALYSRGVSRFDSGPDTDPRTEQALSSYAIHSRNRLASHWESLLRVGTSRDDSSTLDAGYPGEFRTDQDQVLWQHTVRLDATSVVAGVEYLRERVATSTDYSVSRRTIRSAFAGMIGEYGSHRVQLDLRRDDNSQYGAPISGSVAYGYRITPEAKVRAAYGKAFHAPSFNDLYYPGFGNPALRPETGRSREVGFDYAAGTRRFAATWFDNRISELIVFAFDPASQSFLPVNVARARIRGLELSASARWRGTRVKAMLTLQDPESEDTGSMLQRRARRHGSLAADRAFGPWTLGAELVASGPRFDSADESPDSRLHGYAVLNLTVVRRLTPAWSAELRWNNVGDTAYERVRGYHTPGSNALLTLRWNPV